MRSDKARIVRFCEALSGLHGYRNKQFKNISLKINISVDGFFLPDIMRALLQQRRKRNESGEAGN
jgi:hypothetical protein